MEIQTYNNVVMGPHLGLLQLIFFLLSQLPVLAPSTRSCVILSDCINTMHLTAILCLEKFLSMDGNRWIAFTFWLDHWRSWYRKAGLFGWSWKGDVIQGPLCNGLCRVSWQRYRVWARRCFCRLHDIYVCVQAPCQDNFTVLESNNMTF